MKDIGFHELAQLFSAHTNFVLTTHVHPDGDAIGSVIACYEILSGLKKNVRVINFSPTPFFLSFLDSDSVIEPFSEKDHSAALSSAEVLVVLDFNRCDRAVGMASLIRSSSAVKICIDHHQDPEAAFDFILTDTTACATAHLLYRLIAETGLTQFTPKIALGIYAGIMTDTGSFRFDRTTPEVHQIAAHLLEFGVNPQFVYTSIFDNSSIGRLKMLGEALQSIQLYGEDKSVAVMKLFRSVREGYGVAEFDTEGFVNMCMSIDTVRVAIKIMEVTPGLKISLRSKGKIPMHLLAAKFGGGGHLNAAGIRLRDTTIDEVLESVVTDALQLVQEYN